MPKQTRYEDTFDSTPASSGRKNPTALWVVVSALSFATGCLQVVNRADAQAGAERWSRLGMAATLLLFLASVLAAALAAGGHSTRAARESDEGEGQ